LGAEDLEKENEEKNRGRLVFGPRDVRETAMLGRIINIHDGGITWQGDPRYLDEMP
jgi:hypothetical protein